MDVFFEFLLSALLIMLIVGLINPSLVLRWGKKPTRKKVFGWWLLANVFFIIVWAICSPSPTPQQLLDSAKSSIEKEDYSAALHDLKKIAESDSLYSEAQLLIVQADSLLVVQKNEKANKKNEKEKSDEKEIFNKKTDANTEEAKIAEQKAELKREIESIDKGVDFSAYHNATTVTVLQLELAIFSVWGTIINENEHSNDAEIKALTNKLKTKVVNIQVKEFPILRKQYGKIVAKLFWEHDIDISITGAGNKNINISGGLFATNKNKQDFQNQVHEVLTLFRFNQSRYRWYKGADDYTYWTVYEGKDSDLVTYSK